MKNILIKCFSFLKSHKFLTVLLCLLVFCFCLSAFVAINWPNRTGQSVLSITLDKCAMVRVNKVEIETPKGITIIKDRELIKDIVKCTLVAKNAGLSAIYGHYFIRLYKDDVLVRDMDVSLYNNFIRVYYRSKKHFIFDFGTYGGESGGQVSISQELLDRIQQYLVEDGNSFGEVDGTYQE